MCNNHKFMHFNIKHKGTDAANQHMHHTSFTTIYSQPKCRFINSPEISIYVDRSNLQVSLVIDIEHIAQVAYLNTVYKFTQPTAS